MKNDSRHEDTELAIAALNLMNAQETDEQALQLAHWALDILQPDTPDDYVIARLEVKAACGRYVKAMESIIDAAMDNFIEGDDNE